MPVMLSSSYVAGYQLTQASYKYKVHLDCFVAKVLSKCLRPNDVISVFAHIIHIHRVLEALSHGHRKF